MNLNPIALYRQIAVILKIRSEGAKLMEELKTKPGWKSTEFWLSLAGGLATIGAAAAPFIPAAALPYIAGVSFALPAIYTIARTIAKLTPGKADDAFLDALAAKLAPLIKIDAPVVVVAPVAPPAPPVV